MNWTVWGLTLATVTAASTVLAEGSTESFLREAIEGNLAEIQMGQMAIQKGESQAVKDLGRKMVDDHTAANTRAVALAVKLGVPVPTAPNNDAQEDVQELLGYSGAKFDEEFIDEVVDNHDDSLELYEKQAKRKGDGAVTAYAAEMLPVIRAHAATARALDK